MASRSVFVLATVLSVQGRFAYPCCTRCRKRVRTLEQDQKFSCSSCKQCYEGDEVPYRFRVNLMVSDRSQVANVTVFGSCLDVFFGASATEFTRFLGRLQYNLADHTIEPNRLVHQAMQQCFVGSMLKFGFRLSPPCRVDSQILRSSPVNLDNVALKQQTQTESHQDNMPSLLANIVVPCVSAECQTVLGILQSYIERLHPTIGCTPCSPEATSVHAASHNGRSSRNCEVSGIRCSGATGLSMLTSPLVLTCDSQADHCSIPCTVGQCSEFAADHDPRNTDVPMTPTSEKDCFEDCPPWYLASQEHRDLKRTPCHSQPLGASKSSSTLLMQHEPCGYLDCQDTNTSQHCPEIKWSQLEDLPSSEDLSAFLADLALDSDFTEDGEGQVVVVNEQCAPAPDRFNECESLNELSTAAACHKQWENFDDPSVAVELQNETTDVGPGDLIDAECELVTLVNAEDAVPGCHDNMESFSQPIEAVGGKLHNFTNLRDLSLGRIFTGDEEGLVAIMDEEALSDSSACHAGMRSSNYHKPQKYSELKHHALDDPLADGDDEGKNALSILKTTSWCHVNETRGFNEPSEKIGKLQNFTELTDLPSSEDLEVFLADMDEDCFLENVTCPAGHSPTKTIQASSFPNSLKSSAPEEISFICDKSGNGDLQCETSIAVESGSEKVIFEGHDGFGACSIAGRLLEESAHQESTQNGYNLPKVLGETPVRVTSDTKKVCRATKRAQESNSNNLRVALLRKLTWSDRGYSVSSPNLSPLKKIRRNNEQRFDRVCENPVQEIRFGMYSEELFTSEVSSSSGACDSCTQDDSSGRSTEFTDVFTCEESAGVNRKPNNSLDSSGVCSSSGKYGAQEAEKSVTDKKAGGDLCPVSPNDSSRSDVPSYFGSPELFSPVSSSPDTHEGSPCLFSPEKSEDCSSSCEASGSILLFSSQASYLSSCGSENLSNVNKTKSSIYHSTPVLIAQREAKASSPNYCSPRALPFSKIVTPHSWDISGTALTESPLLFSQLSNISFVNSP